MRRNYTGYRTPSMLSVVREFDARGFHDVLDVAETVGRDLYLAPKGIIESDDQDNHQRERRRHGAVFPSAFCGQSIGRSVNET